MYRMKAFSVVLLFILLASYVAGDCYMHNPRGSNGRHSEDGTDRNNGARLMDTQNNAKGGYCWGPPMKFYEKSILSIEWTAQHSCGHQNSECQIILQYMCSDNGKVQGTATDAVRVRDGDGSTTNTIPDDVNQFNTKNANGEFVYGMHESYQYYQDCKTRSRNKGLFIADRNLNGNDARFTRQNNNGNRNGFECAEERDYYPYWAPSPWKDIAILTTDKSDLCSYYESESQNVKSRMYCSGTPQNGNKLPITQQECLAAGFQWLEFPAWGIKAPDCVAAPWSRDNHLGNGFDGHTNSYNWTLPSSSVEPCIENNDCACVLRIRYNISTADTDNWGLSSGEFVDSKFNGKKLIQNDPYVAVEGMNLSLALDTSQYGRTFQDRSHMFTIAPRPDGVSNDATIWNLNVRGKRGNIVQTYPATEYDFVPTMLHVDQGDYIHFQWTGCDHNPANNAGEGKDKTDRSNIVQMMGPGFNYPADDAAYGDDIPALFEDREQRQLMAYLGQTGCDPEADDDDDDANCYKLNRAPAYFDGGLIKMNKTGEFHYMSTRNNNFSNRSQKGVITVEPKLKPWQIGLISAGAVVGGVGAACAGLLIFAKMNPHSRVADMVHSVGDKFRR